MSGRIRQRVEVKAQAFCIGASMLDFRQGGAVANELAAARRFNAPPFGTLMLRTRPA